MKQTLERATSKSEGDSHDASGKPGQIKYQFLWCFLSIALVAMCVGIFLMIETTRGVPRIPYVGPDNAGALLAAQRWHVALGVGLIIAVTAGVFLSLMRRIAVPLAKTAAAAQRMAEGNLEATLPACTPNEIGRIGENINGLAVNFQEVLTLVWNQTETAIASLRRTTITTSSDQATGLPADILTELKSARQELETMRMMIRSFDLYDVSITRNNALTAKDDAERLN